MHDAVGAPRIDRHFLRLLLACCTIPPVQSSYKSKGSYESFGPFDKTYVVGDSKTHALMYVCLAVCDDVLTFRFPILARILDSCICKSMLRFYKPESILITTVYDLHR